MCERHNQVKTSHLLAETNKDIIFCWQRCNRVKTSFLLAITGISWENEKEQNPVFQAECIGWFLFNVLV